MGWVVLAWWLGPGLLGVGFCGALVSSRVVFVHHGDWCIGEGTWIDDSTDWIFCGLPVGLLLSAVMTLILACSELPARETPEFLGLQGAWICACGAVMLAATHPWVPWILASLAVLGALVPPLLCGRRLFRSCLWRREAG